jgi:hypothetical protein
MANPNAITRSGPIGGVKMTIGTTVAASSAVAMASYSAFAVAVPAGQPGGLCTWYASHSPTGPFSQVILSDGTLAQTTMITDRVHIAPPELFSCLFVKGVAPVANQVIVMLKG